MSELTDHLGLTGEQREIVEQAWASWKLFLGLKRPAMETFRRVLLEHSTVVERGAPPGFAWNHGGLHGSPQGAPLIAVRYWSEPFVIPHEQATRAWNQAKPIDSPEIFYDNAGFCGRSKRDGSVWVRMYVPVTWKNTLKVSREAALMEWQTFWMHLGIHGEMANLLTDFMLENSRSLIDETYPPSLVHPQGELQQPQQSLIRGAMELIGHDPNVIFIFPGVVMNTDGSGGKVTAWRRIDL